MKKRTPAEDDQLYNELYDMGFDHDEILEEMKSDFPFHWPPYTLIERPKWLYPLCYVVLAILSAILIACFVHLWPEDKIYEAKNPF